MSRHGPIEGATEPGEPGEPDERDGSDARGHSAFGVSTARDLVRGLTGLVLALFVMLCAGGLAGDGPRLVRLGAVVVFAAATWLLTREREGTERRNRLRNLVRGLGLLFLVAEVVRFDEPVLEAFDLLVQAPFVVAVGFLVLAHVRPEAPLRSRLVLDLGLAGVGLGLLWSLDVLGGWAALERSPGGQALYGVLLIGVVSCGLALGARWPDTLRALTPAGVETVWRVLAFSRGWTVERDDPGAWIATAPVGEHTVRITVERDPVPPRTTFVLGLPELSGAVVVPNHEHVQAQPVFDDDVLDAALAVEADAPEPVVRAIRSARAAWLRLVPTWGGVLRDGRLQLVFDGARPHEHWVHVRKAREPASVVDEVLAELARVAAAAAPGGPAL